MAATISWQIPATSVDNSFSVTLVSDQVLTGVTLDDFVFVRWVNRRSKQTRLRR